MFQRIPGFQLSWAFIEEQEGSWVGDRRDGIGLGIIAKPKGKVGGSKEEPMGLFPLPSSFSSLKVSSSCLLSPTLHSHMSLHGLSLKMERREKLEVFWVGKPKQQCAEERGILMAPGYPSGISSSISKWLILYLYKRHRQCSYYVNITSVQWYLILLFFRAHRRLFFLAVLANGQGYVTIMTNDMWAEVTSHFWAVAVKSLLWFSSLSAALPLWLCKGTCVEELKYWSSLCFWATILCGGGVFVDALETTQT